MPVSVWVRRAGDVEGMGEVLVEIRGPQSDVLEFVLEQWGDDQRDALLDEWDPPYWTAPEDPDGTVFDPRDETFGPVMAAIQGGAFEEASRLLGELADEAERTALMEGGRMRALSTERGNDD
jgi:hypothetical protein